MNPHLVMGTYKQTPPKQNVWEGIFGNRTVGAFFIKANPNGNTYLNPSLECVDQGITQTLENEEK